MSRSLSQTLIRSSISLSPSTNGSRFANFRYRSNSPENFKFSGEFPAEDTTENTAVKNLEDVIHSMIVKKSQPNWIPFVPGASYWVPPKSKAQGYARVIGKLVNKNDNYNLIKDYNNNNNNHNHGWPSSAHFFKGASHCPLEGDATFKHTTQSEDEEG